jgi:hypothetical protein
MGLQQDSARKVGWKALTVAALGVGACIGFTGCAPMQEKHEGAINWPPSAAEQQQMDAQADAARAEAQRKADESQTSATTAPTTAPVGVALAPATPTPGTDSEQSANKPDDDQDDNLATLQNAKVQFPAKIRLGVVHWRAVGAPTTPADLVFTDPDMQKEIASHLQAGGRVVSVIFVPAWMTEGLKVGKLRAIAARCNVDALLVYDDTTTVSSLGLGEPIVGSCAGEAILLDAKTGLIPATFSAAGDHTAAAPPRDVDPQPERDGVAQRASLEAANKIADAAAGQLNAMP